VSSLIGPLQAEKRQILTRTSRTEHGTRFATPQGLGTMLRAVALFVAPLLVAGFAQGPIDFGGTARLGGKPVHEAVVWLDAPAGVAPVAHPKAVLDQRNLSFFPHVLVVQLGTKVEFPNHDRVFHNVFSDHDGKKFNLGLYPVGMVKEVPFDRPGLSRIFCNIHPQMSAYVMVVDTPYFALSDQTGRFTIRGVMPGTHRYHAWRAGGPIVNGSATVSAGGTLEVTW
jgi:plastocyanin